MWFAKKKIVNKNYVRRRREYSHTPIFTFHARASGQRNQRFQRAAAIALLVVALGGVAWLLMLGSSKLRDMLFVQNQRFVLTGVEASSTGRLTSDHIKEFGGIVEGQNLFSLPLEAIRSRLENVPTIRSVQVQRKLPSTLIVRVDERIPVAKIPQGQAGFFFSVDNDSHVLGLAGSQWRHLPLIKGFSDRGITPGSVMRDAGTANALELIKSLEGNPAADIIRISSIDVSYPDYLDLALEGDVTVRVPRHVSARKIDDLARILRESAGKCRFIDMTVDRNVPCT